MLKEFPWLTATCCGIHVISLELKDLAKLPEVAAIIEKMGIILSLFWGRKRWPRTRLKEVIFANHARRFGMYRAKQTRMAGKFREMSRGLRVKADLQQVVVSADYARQQFSARGRAADVEEGEQYDPAIGEKVKGIVLDEDGFWKPLTLILHVAMPLIKLLRMMDSRKACIGKVYDRMFMIGQRLESLSSRGVPWAPQMMEKHATRWEYLHSPFHAAAYALDPEFLATVGELDGPTQDGLMTVIERMCLRDVMMSLPDPERDWRTVTVTSPDVVQRVAQAEREFSAYQRREGPFSRPSVMQNAKTMEPAAWWGQYGRHLPLLSAFAARILAQPPAAGQAERNWSVYGQIRSDHRSRMKHSTADKLVFCHETLALETRMQDAGWQPDVEKWESDTDSDGSDEEQDWSGQHHELSDEQILRLCQ